MHRRIFQQKKQKQQGFLCYERQDTRLGHSHIRESDHQLVVDDAWRHRSCVYHGCVGHLAVFRTLSFSDNILVLVCQSFQERKRQRPAADAHLFHRRQMGLARKGDKTAVRSDHRRILYNIRGLKSGGRRKNRQQLVWIRYRTDDDRSCRHHHGIRCPRRPRLHNLQRFDTGCNHVLCSRGIACNSMDTRLSKRRNS